MHIHTIQLNIEKLNGGTSFMDAAEFGAYMALIIACYQSKNKLPDDDSRLARLAKCTPKVWARVKETVSQKFEVIDGFWSHLVVQSELDKYESLSTKNRANALKRNGTPKPVASQSHSDRTANINNNNQITNNYNKDITPLPPKRGKPYSRPQDVSENVWRDFETHRKAKRAPITETVIKSMRGEAFKVSLSLEQAIEMTIARNWQGFKAEWVMQKSQSKNKVQSQIEDIVQNGW